MESIFVVKFNVESEAYQALTELRQDPENDDFTVSEAYLVNKKDGSLTVADRFDTGIESVNDTDSGALIGSLVGILGGPVGVLLGASYGALIGSTIDLADSLDNASLIEQVCGTLEDNGTAVIALVTEKKTESFDAKMKKFDTVVKWYDSEEVAAEVEKARELEREMQKEARKQLREAKKEELKQKVDSQRQKISDKIEDLKDKLS